MKQFHSYFHPDNVIHLLCKYRIKYAKSKHKLHLLADISSSDKTISDFKKSAVPDELSKLIPPRRRWYKPTLEERKRISDSQKLQEYSLFKTILTVHIKAKGSNHFSPPDWYVELDSFIKKIQGRINSPDIQKIQTPEIKPIKKENTKSCKECRPISIYNLEDRIIISLTAKYFTETFDDCFHDCSYAFRAVKEKDYKKVVRTHHDAIQKISEFHSQNSGKDIFVSECDIQKFFDCVNHKLVIKSLNNLATRYNIILNKNAKAIFIQYLKSYSFSRDVYPKNKTDYFSELKMENAEFKWVGAELKRKFYNFKKYNSTLSNVEIGVPQGGALSCFISNLLLHYVDDSVVKSSDKNLLYLRFCDDMVILHTQKDKCEKALERYEKAISRLKLLIHPPQEITHYSKAFWKTKSKKPYKWAPNSVEKSNVPWLSFVGYQIKYDGSIRVRKKSLQKELKKQNEECQKILKALNYFNVKDEVNSTSKKSRKQQLYALENRLISMSVGRIKLHDADKNQSLCWTNGFKALNFNPTAIKQLKILDTNRTKQLYKIKKELKELITRSNNPDPIDNKKTFFGAPYSYHNFLAKQNKPKGIPPNDIVED